MNGFEIDWIVNCVARVADLVAVPVGGRDGDPEPAPGRPARERRDVVGDGAIGQADESRMQATEVTIYR